MKHNRSHLILTATVAGALALGLGACSKPESEKQAPPASSALDQAGAAVADAAAATKDAAAASWEKIKDATYDERAAFHDGVARMAEGIDDKIDVLQQKGGELSADARGAWNDGVAHLQDARETLDEKLEDLGNATADTWDSAKSEVASAWQQVQQACQNLEQRISS